MTISAAAILQLIQQIPSGPGEFAIPWGVFWPVLMGLFGLLCSITSIAVALYARTMAQNMARIELALEKLVVQGMDHGNKLAKIEGQGLEGRISRIEGNLLGGRDKRDRGGE